MVEKQYRVVAKRKLTVESNTTVKKVVVKKKKDYIVMIDPGHGDHNNENSMIDPGATYPIKSMLDKVKKMIAKKEFACLEKDIAVNIGKVVKKELDSLEICTYLTRDADIGNGSLEKIKWRVDKAVSNKCTLFVSIHTNSVDDKNKNGFVVIYRSNAGKVLAQELVATQKIISINGNGLNMRINLGVLNGFERRVTNGVGVLIEVGYISNEAEAKIMVNMYNDIGKQIASGINNYIEKQKESDKKHEEEDKMKAGTQKGIVK